MTEPHDLTVTVDGDLVAARRFPTVTAALIAHEQRPCVVLAHGIGATQDSGLAGFAEAIAQAGMDAVTFDYRHFGRSGGGPRQLVSPARQVADYLAVVDHVRGLEGVDPQRVAVWGVSFSGGHVLDVAARDPRVAAVVSMTPAVDGLAVVRGMLGTQRPGYFGRLVALAVRDAAAAVRRRQPVTAPIVAAPGGAAALNSPGALEGMHEIAGPTWRNEFAARLFLQVAAWRPTRRARRVSCPTLVQIGDLDRSAPPAAAARAAQRAGARVHHYPCDHFDVYPGQPWHDRAVADQIAFLVQSLTPATRVRCAG